MQIVVVIWLTICFLSVSGPPSDFLLLFFASMWCEIKEKQFSFQLYRLSRSKNTENCYLYSSFHSGFLSLRSHSAAAREAVKWSSGSRGCLRNYFFLLPAQIKGRGSSFCAPSSGFHSNLSIFFYLIYDFVFLCSVISPFTLLLRASPLIFPRFVTFLCFSIAVCRPGRAGGWEKLFYYLSYFCRLSEVNFVCCLLRTGSPPSPLAGVLWKFMKR